VKLCFASRQTYTQETTTKLTKKNSTEKHKWKRSECDHVRKKGKKTSEADSFRHMEIKIYYTLEDGHVGRNMYCKTLTTNTIQLHEDGNITCKTH
jgi:hypothetical protein